MKNLIYLLLATALLWQLQGCDDDVNPCEGEEPVTARFDVGVRINDGYTIDSLFLMDTVLAFDAVRFVAQEGYNKYTWKVGNDSRVFEDRSFGLRFPDPVSNLPITLIVEKSPNTACFPEDDGIDTLTRYLTVVDRGAHQIFGDYQGYLEGSPEDTFTVSFFADDIYGIRMRNINRGCDSDGVDGANPNFMQVTYKTAVIAGDPTSYYGNSGCMDPKGWFRVETNGIDVVAEYTILAREDFRAGVENRITKKFIGRKVE